LFSFLYEFFQKFLKLLLIGFYEPNTVSEVDILKKFYCNPDSIPIYLSNDVIYNSDAKER